jgi:hypothetical protein
VTLAKSFAVAFISTARASLTIKSTSFPPYGEFNPPAGGEALAEEVLLEVEMAVLLSKPTSIVDFTRI